MCGRLRLFVVVGLLAVWCAAEAPCNAKGPKGRGSGGFQGGRGGGFHGGGPKGGSFNDGGHHGGWKWNNDNFKWEQSRQPEFSRWPRSSLDNSAGDHPFSKQRLVEEQKLAHRRHVADHLRDISERNGNENLKDVADRMEQKAQQHYERRLTKIDDNVGPDEFDNIPHAPRDLTGRENALDRQLQSAERTFTQRMQAADQLRQLAASTGDAQILEAADRLEETAFSHYEQRLSQIGQFQDRFDLPAARDFLPSLPFGVR